MGNAKAHLRADGETRRALKPAAAEAERESSWRLPCHIAGASNLNFPRDDFCRAAVPAAVLSPGRCQSEYPSNTSQRIRTTGHFATLVEHP